MAGNGKSEKVYLITIRELWRITYKRLCYTLNMAGFRGICVCLLLFLAASKSDATTFLIKSEEEKIIEAPWICAVKVLKILDKPPPFEVKSRTPMTFANVTLAEPCLKGETASEFYVGWPGGAGEVEIKGKKYPSHTRVPGATNLVENQIAILYLVKAREDDPYFQAYGMINGVVNLKKDPNTGELVLKHEPLRTAPQSGHAVTASDDRTLKGFRARVQQVLNQNHAR
jgi:hypothetical protein